LTPLIAYLVVGISLLGVFIISIPKLKTRDKRYYSVFLITFFLLFSMGATLIFPGIILYDLALALMCYVMYFTIENPDIRLLKQLEIAKDQAEKANRAKTDFLSSMSHEIRTPLNAIVGFSDFIMDSNDLGEAKNYAKDVISASQTLLEIVNGILDISKIEAGKLEIANSSYPAREVFLELAKLITPRMTDKGLDFTYHIAEDLPEYLYGDSANIKKVVTNLLSNASKYTEKGYVHYEVNCVTSGDYTKLIISVEDSGRGIKKENVDKLFTKFQRLEEDRNTTIEGTGLGLAITKQLTELMGGQIIVHTVYGEGSKFTVVLNQKIDRNPRILSKKLKDTLNLQDVRILLVDDTLLNLKVATKLLEKYQANCITTCESGFECLERIKNGEEYDVILLDDMMPKMSGVITLEKLKEIEGFHTPVVALTANAISGMREKYLKDGFQDYLAKPIEKEKLIQVMNQILGRCITAQIDTVSILDTTSNDHSEVEQLEEDSTTYDRKFLEENGVDISHALELLGDMEMYNMTIHDFYDDVSNKWNQIKEFKEQNNMKEYSILVHSLKSDCKYLGFMKLADISYQHELKSKENDSNFIKHHFKELEEEYLKVYKIVKEYVEHI
ncbi:MAG: response regulator, partial [Bacilli bacterium]|nr:response regulator [Bacilli bacterium]